MDGRSSPVGDQLAAMEQVLSRWTSAPLIGTCMHVTIGTSAVDVIVRFWHRVGGESLVARRRGSGVRLPLGLVVARQSQALYRTYN